MADGKEGQRVGKAGTQTNVRKGESLHEWKREKKWENRYEIIKTKKSVQGNCGDRTKEEC
jgi:hypothetical protein